MRHDEPRDRARLVVVVALVVLGAAAGLAIQRAVGCPLGGGCPITGNPVVSTVYGAIIGLVVGLGVAPGSATLK